MGKAVELRDGGTAHGAQESPAPQLARVEVWHRQGVTRELLTVAQPADGAYLLLRMEQENHPNLDEARRLLSWNGGGANSSGRGIANIDTQGNVHPDQFWQDLVLGNVKEQPFSQIWEGICGGGFRTRAAYSENGGLLGRRPWLLLVGLRTA